MAGRDADPGAPEVTDEPMDQAPPGVVGPSGWLLKVVKDQRIAFLMVGATNTLIGFLWFVFFQHFVGQHVGYMVTLICAHVASVLCAFWLYRLVVFRVRGHVLRDLARFESVYLSALAVNALLLPLLVEIGGLPVIVSQLLIVTVTSMISWFGHKHFSFRRPGKTDSTTTSTSAPARGVPSEPVIPPTPTDTKL